MSGTVDRLDDPLERWPGYHEQSWQQRFNELNRRYNERVVQLDVALCKVALARLTTPPARSYADEDVETQWEVWEDDLMVASSTDEADARHYLAVYSQDGPVRLVKSVTVRTPVA